MTIRRSKIQAFRLSVAIALAFGSLAVAQARQVPPLLDATYSVLHVFTGAPGDGDIVDDAPTAASDGSYYGTTHGGGLFDRGTIYKLDADGTESVVHNFTGVADGFDPQAPLVVDPQGNLYGVAAGGKIGLPYCAGGCGLIYKLSPEGVLTVLHAFARSGAEGYEPNGGLIRDANGNLFGTTYQGGEVDGEIQSGVVFKLAPNGRYTILHTFNGEDGQNPTSLLRDPAGNLYGTTAVSSTSLGVVFKLTRDGTYSSLYEFPDDNVQAGYGPSNLIRDPGGNLYGVTYGGGDASVPCPNDEFEFGCGTVFKLTPDGTHTTLYSFTGFRDGKQPEALVRDPASGVLYGVTYSGGARTSCGITGGCGTAFALTPAGNLRILHTFDYDDGAKPVSLIKRGDQLIGTAQQIDGPTVDAGVLFSLDLSQ